jgi:hypothetical protein
MAFTSTDPFLRATLDSIGVLSQTNASFKEINLRLSISWQDIYWRVRAADDYAHDFESLSSQPITLERYYLETKALFGFFTSALSALECFFYAAYFVGNAAVDPTKITPGASLKKFHRDAMVSFFNKYFYNDPFTQSLVVFIGSSGKGTKTPADPTHKEIRKIRDAISHKATPGRSMRLFTVNPFTWLLSDLISGATNQELDKDFLVTQHDWLEREIRRLGTELEDFWKRKKP